VLAAAAKRSHSSSVGCYRALASQEITDDLDLLLEILPPAIKQSLQGQDEIDSLIEIVMDLGRPPEARFPSGTVVLGEEPVSPEAIHVLIDRLGEFSGDNRAGIERTLHRISAIRNRRNDVVGLTCRVGRAVLGTVDILRDVVESGKSLLLLGRPGIGKTTLLRESARVLSTELNKRVIVVDTSNEIAGDGDIPHPGIGSARRMQVPRPERQHAVMIEAVENHMPEVIVIDEIGTEPEALAARTIAERGVQLVATAHGNALDNLLMNPTLADLLGGIHAVTLGDEEARRRKTQKTVLERKAPPTFDTLVEIRTRDCFAVYHETASVVDAYLRGRKIRPEVRLRGGDGFEVLKEATEEGTTPDEGPPVLPFAREELTGHERARSLRIYPFGISKDRLLRAIADLRVPATIARIPREANLVLTLKAHERRHPRTLEEMAGRGVEIAVIRSNTISQMKAYLEGVFGLQEQDEAEIEALREAREGIDRVLSFGNPVELAPRGSPIRRQQHMLVEEMGLGSYSRGEMPWRRVVVLPTRG
jgi:stage III sporulation protein SpoIIIAA